jgi:hypothetical protein
MLITWEFINILTFFQEKIYENRKLSVIGVNKKITL